MCVLCYVCLLCEEGRRSTMSGEASGWVMRGERQTGEEANQHECERQGGGVIEKDEDAAADRASDEGRACALTELRE